MKMRVVCCGYYGKGNAGDEALMASLLQMLPSECTPCVLSGNPQQTRDRYQVASYNRMSAFDVFQLLRKSDAFIWGGGSLIQDATSALSPIYYIGLMGLAQQMGLKTIAWAQGVGPLNRPAIRNLARQAFAGCDAVTVRDMGSAQLLSEWQIPPMVIAPDPVWALAAKPLPQEANAQKQKRTPAPRVAVNLRSHPQLTPARLATLTRALIDFQTATNTGIILVPFQASLDQEIAESIHAQLPGKSHIVSLEDPQEIKGLFQGVKMAIGMRYHSLIMAAAEKCRCFALSYDPKVSQLMKEINIPGWELSNLPEDPHLISQSWLEHYTNGQALSDIKIKSIVDRAKMHQELLHEVLLN
jgi:polysaccharide pyruvyl transferase CsaB